MTKVIGENLLKRLVFEILRKTLVSINMAPPPNMALFSKPSYFISQKSNNHMLIALKS